MKMLFLFFVIASGSILLWFYAKPEKIEKSIKTIEKNVKTSQITPQQNAKEYIFVPYWSFTKNIATDSDQSLIYFGLGVNEDGIETKDDGYKKLKTFNTLTPNAKEKIMAVRMTDKNINAQILKDLTTQEKIASQAVSIAVNNYFDGILLDYETSAFAFDSTIDNIANFYTLFSKKVKEQDLLFYVTLYGDTYFRARPYDVAKIAKIADKVVIMTYDFSKSRGNPGPNFPLADNNNYGYDLGKMVDDFQKDVDNQKIAVALGYFGYDWRTNEVGESVTSGVPLSINEINKEFVESCGYDNCQLNRVKSSSEPSIKYKDDNGENHIIWFEDSKSANIKKEFLKKKGILETAAWAYSYY